MSYMHAIFPAHFILFYLLTLELLLEEESVNYKASFRIWGPDSGVVLWKQKNISEEYEASIFIIEE
jgi:hypothetical protein